MEKLAKMLDLPNAFVASVAQELNAAGVPRVWWGHYLLRTHGVATIVTVNLLDTTTAPKRCSQTISQ